MTIEITPPSGYTDVESVLRRRGHRIHDRGDPITSLFPQERSTEIRENIGAEAYNQFFKGWFKKRYFESFQRRSFRKVAKMLIDRQPNAVPNAALATICGDKLDEYLLLFRNLMLIEEVNGTVRLTRPLTNLGPSLEHYVADLMEIDFRGSAEWGVHLEEIDNRGGDYDVITWLDPSLVYIECKTSDPNNITKDHVRNFLYRSVALAPEIAIFLVDTDDSVEPLVLEKFRSTINAAQTEEFSIFFPDPEDDWLPPKGYPKIHHVFTRPSIYVTGPMPSIERQISRCLRHYYSKIRGMSFYHIQDDFS